MLKKRKFASLTLGALIGIGGIGTASAALLPSGQQNDVNKDTPVTTSTIQPSNVKNQVNPISKISTTNGISADQMKIEVDGRYNNQTKNTVTQPNSNQSSTSTATQGMNYREHNTNMDTNHSYNNQTKNTMTQPNTNHSYNNQAKSTVTQPNTSQSSTSTATQEINYSKHNTNMRSANSQSNSYHNQTEVNHQGNMDSEHQTSRFSSQNNRME